MLRVAEQFSHSDTGLQRRANEDAFLERAPLFVVADGMGGAQGGEVASRIAVEHFARGFSVDGAEDPAPRLAARAVEANAEIYSRARGDAKLDGMGTTLTVAYVGPQEISLAHVGDSRAYRLHDGTLERLTSDHSLVEELIRQGRLTEEEAERAVSQALVARYALSPEAVTDVLEAKKELLRHSGMLQFVDVSETMASIGGLENLKRWLAQRRGAWDEAARAFGLEPPRGMVVLGVQGCGKSMCARAVAGEWKLPLVKFDSSAVFDKYIGETEKRIQKVFQVAESLSPCVLWIDELEKVFAGSGPDSASVDAGVSSRILAAFLSWMQDRKAPVFVAATCNNVTALPPELIRKGRFDELFFVDLPNQAERKAILAIQLARRKHNPAEFDLEQIARAADGYSGAEIDAALQSAMYRSFADKQALATQSLLQALAVTVPLSTTRAEEIEALREWARSRAVPASLADAKAQAIPSK